MNAMIHRISPETIPSRAALVTEVMTREAAAIMAAASNDTLVAAIDEAAALIACSKAPLIVAGIGKSGHIGKKLVASFCSLGKPAIFLHAAEASHGDLGIVGPDSVLLVLSNSGETGELSDLLAYAETYGNPIIGLTANEASTLGRASQIVLAYGKQAEVCRNGLAPTTSTAVTLAVGDALAVAVSDIYGFRPEDFRRYHPGGKLGARLARAEAAMTPVSACLTIAWNAPAVEALLTMARSGTGFVLVRAEGSDTVLGILSGSMIDAGRVDLMTATAGDLALVDPISVDPQTPSEEASRLMTACDTDVAFVRHGDGPLLGVLRRGACGR